MSQRKPNTNEEIDQVKIYRATNRAYSILKENYNIQEIQLRYILKLWDSITDEEGCPEEVEYILTLIKHRPKISWRKLDSFLEAKYKNNIKIEREYEHVFHRAKLRIRLDELLEKGMLTNKQHCMMCENFRAMSNCAGKLLKLEDEEMKEILQKAFTRFPKFDITRERLDIFLAPEFEKRNICGRNPEHDKLTREVAIPFLKSKGCLFPATEVVVIPGKSGFKADALGYKGNEVWGIEVKRTVADFKKGIEKDQYKAYMQFCNVFYILTDNKKVESLATQWSKQKTDGAVGVLYTKDFSLLDEISGAKREINEQDRTQAIESLSSKYLNNVVQCAIQANVNKKPEVMIEAIKEQLASSVR